MHLSETNATPKNVHVVQLPMREMLAVQDSKIVKLGIPKPHGVPDIAFKLILDAHNKGLRDARVGIPPAENLGKALLRRLANLRAPSWRAESDPVFWLLRVRRDLREATLSLPGVQPGDVSTRAYTPQEWDTEQPSSGSAMASWAYRCWDRDERLDQVCSELLNEGLLPRPSYTVCQYSAGHRVLWYMQARGCSRERAWQISSDADIFPDWRTQVRSGYL